MGWDGRDKVKPKLVPCFKKFLKSPQSHLYLSQTRSNLIYIYPIRNSYTKKLYYHPY